MVNKKAAVIATLVLAVLLLWPLAGIAAGAAKPAPVVDLAGLFTTAEADLLSQQAIALGEQYAMDMVIVTTADAEGKSSREYADDYFDDRSYGVGEDRDGILFLLDMDNREAYISTSGRAIRYLTDARIERVLDAVFAAGLAEGDRYGATQAFLDATAGFLAEGIPPSQQNVVETEANSLTAVEGIGGAVVASILGLGFFVRTRLGYRSKPRPGSFDYRSYSSVSLGVITDNLVNSYTSTRIIPKVHPPVVSSGGGSRSTTHRSSSGRSHGGGGRKF